MKNKKNRIVVIAVVALILVVGLFVGLYLGTRPETHPGSKTITVEVTHKDGTQKTFTYHTDEEYLAPVLEKEGLVQGEQSQYGLTIHTVDGETDNWAAGEYWLYYKGGEMVNTGVSQTPIADGDVFQFEYSAGGEW